ncbi:hypothetical protein GpartN1_g5701.t1 [Galdieria partita]|uniref:Uncharacterized protein n=1 Tax=Galdieria partita TaxID=83374 RepID=A0A9C7Q0N3_9RHOD|nr:hypothetical protein GpartN1_g5701.t1 [Galdieria partita]
MVAMLVGCFAFSFHSTCLSSANVRYSFQTKVCFGTKECRLWSRSFTKPLSCFDKNRSGFGYRRVILASVINSLDGGKERYVDFREIFVPNEFKIDEKFSNVWLTNLPNLHRECVFKTVASVLGEKIQVGGKVFEVGEETFRDTAHLVAPKQFPEDFPVEGADGKISRIFLRREFIKRWNKHIESLDAEGCSLPRRQIIVSAASGLGKSVELYMAAVFSRHCGIPVQYIANTWEWLTKINDISDVFSGYLKMLLFMNADILEEMPCFMTTDYDSLNGVPLKDVIYFAMKEEDTSLASEIRRFMIRLAPRNMLIVDEHNEFWCNFGRNINRWPDFFRFYAIMEVMATPYCGVLLAGSQHRQFEDNLPSGYVDIKQYLEPLSFKEFDLWQDLPDYPSILRQHSDEVVELTGLVPRMIAKMIAFANDLPDPSWFEDMKTKFTADVCSEMIEKHWGYIKRLGSEREKSAFDSMLYKLFMDRTKPNITIADEAYISRGLLVVVDAVYLRFYNSDARGMLLSSFLNRYASKSYLSELVERYRSGQSTKGQTFKELFFLWFISRTEEVTIRSDSKPRRKLSLSCHSWFRLVGDEFDPPMKKFNHSCWILLAERCPRFDYIFVDIVDSQWHIYFFQISVSSFHNHNRDYAAIEKSLLPLSGKEEDEWKSSGSASLSTRKKESAQNSTKLSKGRERSSKKKSRDNLKQREVKGDCQLLNMLCLILNREFTIILEEDDSGRVVDFRLLDSKGVDWRHCISIVYVTPLSFKEAKGSLSVPNYVEFLCREGFPENFRVLLEEEK